MKIKITSNDYTNGVFGVLLGQLLFEKGVEINQLKYWCIFVPIIIIYYLIFKIFKHYD